MQFGLRLILEPQLEASARTEIQMDDDTRRAIVRAQELWETVEHQTMRVRVADIAALLGTPEDDLPEGINKNETWNEDFAMISKEEMRELDSEEKVGVRMSDCIFVCEDTPEEFVPLVVLNLLVSKQLKDGSPVVKLLESQGLETNMALHWTANIIDTLAAEKMSAHNKGFLQRYLVWRKQVERSTFYQHPTVDAYLGRLLEQKRYRRTTHPKQRGRWVRRSWRVLEALNVHFGQDTVDDHYWAMGGSHADAVLFQITREKGFSPEHMLRLIDLMRQSFVRESRRVINLSGKEDALTRQAWLISTDAVGRKGVLEMVGTDIFKLRRRLRIKTLQALCDRIALAYRNSIQKFVQESESGSHLLELLRSMNRVKSFVLNDGALIFSSGEDGMNRETGESTRMQLLEEKKQTEELLRQYEALEKEFAKVAGEEGIPESLRQKRRELSRHREKLGEKEQSLRSSLDLMERLRELQERHRALLEHSVLDDLERVA